MEKRFFAESNMYTTFRFARRRSYLL